MELKQPSSKIINAAILRLAYSPLGLLMNFNGAVVKEDITRIGNAP